MLFTVGFCKYGLVKNICPASGLAGSNRNSCPNEIIGAPIVSAVAEIVFFKKFRPFALIFMTGLIFLKGEKLFQILVLDQIKNNL